MACFSSIFFKTLDHDNNCDKLSQVKLGEPGYKERYYAEKFELSKLEMIDNVRQDVVSSST